LWRGLFEPVGYSVEVLAGELPLKRDPPVELSLVDLPAREVCAIETSIRRQRYDSFKLAT